MTKLNFNIPYAKQARYCTCLRPWAKAAKKVSKRFFRQQHSSNASIKPGCYVVNEHKYLGTCIGYGGFEDATLALRIRQASSSFA